MKHCIYSKTSKESKIVDTDEEFYSLIKSDEWSDTYSHWNVEIEEVNKEEVSINKKRGRPVKQKEE